MALPCQDQGCLLLNLLHNMLQKNTLVRRQMMIITCQGWIIFDLTYLAFNMLLIEEELSMWEHLLSSWHQALSNPIALGWITFLHNFLQAISSDDNNDVTCKIRTLQQKTLQPRLLFSIISMKSEKSLNTVNLLYNLILCIFNKIYNRMYNFYLFTAQCWNICQYCVQDNFLPCA